MFRVNTVIVLMSLFVLGSLGSLRSYAATNNVVGTSNHAEFFGLQLNDLPLSKLEKHLQSIGLASYPSYRDGVANYSLGPEGIFGVTNATIYTNKSGYLEKALLSGVVDNDEKRQSLGKLLEEKYGTPAVGYLADGIGQVKWFFNEGTVIELRNTTFDVSLVYVDEQPKVLFNSGRIDVEALSRKTQ